MILSNISVPLLGLVDTAVIGHLGSAHYLAGIALGATVISVLFWLAGFLRMSTTGLVAQAYGAKQKLRQVDALFEAMALALVVALLLIVSQSAIVAFMTHFAFAGGEAVSQLALTHAVEYVHIRIWAAPAALLNMVMLGWLLGMQYGRGPFILLLVTNIINIILDIVFVVGLEWGVAGAAWASLIADYSALLVAFLLVATVAQKNQLTWHVPRFSRAAIMTLLSLNRDIFLRSLMLQICFVFITFYGAQFGDATLAANTVLMNFVMLVSFALDGIAYAAEAKVGAAAGQKKQKQVQLWVGISALWGGVFALIYAVIFITFGGAIIHLMTTASQVVALATHYLPWLIAMPVIATACYIFDGVYVGLMQTKAMRNTMLMALIGFFVLVYTTQSLGNHGLWLSFTVFMALRGITLVWHYRRAIKNRTLCA